MSHQLKQYKLLINLVIEPYAALFEYVHIILLFFCNLFLEQMIYQLSRYIIDSQHIHENLLITFLLYSILKNILDFMCLSILNFYHFLHSITLKFYRQILLLSQEDFVAKDTMQVLLLLLYDQVDNFEVFPYLYPK